MDESSISNISHISNTNNSFTNNNNELPPLVGVDEDNSIHNNSPVLPQVKANKKGKRISELQKKFESSGQTSPIQESDVKQKKDVKRDSSRRLTQHWETIRWLRENVLTTKDF
jgi:hypothetical protein